MNLRRFPAIFAALAACAALAQQPAPAVVLDEAALQRRLAAVETLIERSSGAQQVEASRQPAALEKREQARARHAQARTALAAGDLAAAATLLPQASVLMFDAVRLASPEQVVAGKRRTDLDDRVQSARALLAAQKRISQEKSTAGGADTTRAIERLLAQGEAEAAAGHVDIASVAVEQAYLLAKAAIGSMRGGDTLVRSLAFATPEDEYKYELDRNETHRMLLAVLLDPTKNAAAAGAIERAAQLRGQAESAGHGRDFATATRLLEDSTRELVRAIRGAGVYIPG